MTGDTDVLVVGAGPTGLVMACELLRRGVRVRLIDKLTTASDKSRALVVQARSLEVFKNMGVADEFVASGMRTVKIEFYVDGRQRGQLALRDIGADDTPYPYLLMIPQDRTETILTGLLSRLGGRIERGVELKTLMQDADGVTAQLSTGPLRCRWIVGCDGAHSVVRHQIGLPFDGAAYEQGFLLVDAHLGDWPIDVNSLALFVTKQGLLVQFPINGAKNTRLIMTQARRVHQDADKKGFGTEAVTLSDVQAAARELSRTEVRLDDPTWLANFRLHHRGVPRYAVGRVFLAGDAAHIHSPAGGQGMNTGIQDAFNLAWKLALVAQGQAPERLLSSYHDERWPIGRFLLKRTDRFFQVMATRNRWLIAGRNLLVPFVARLLEKGPRRVRALIFRFVSQLGIHYAPSAWIAPGAGQRAPDAPLASGTLFDRLMGTSHHLVCFGIAPPQGINAAFCRVVEVPSSASLAFERYGVAAGGGYVLVRPDGYIALRTSDADAVAKHLEVYL